MHEDTLCLLHGALYEIKDLLRCGFPFLTAPFLDLEKVLILLVKPVELEIDHSYRFPMIGHLSPRTVDNMANFVCHHKLQILYYKMKSISSFTYLSSEFISNEEAILDLDCTDHVVRDTTHHH